MTRTDRRASFAFLALALALMLGTPAFGAADCPALDPIPLSTLLMPPPPNGGEVSMAELHELQLLESVRTDEQARHAKEDHHRSLDRFLAGMGIKLPTHPARVAQFFECVGNATEDAVREAKQHFKRIRPYKYANSWLNILKEAADDDSPSYPSGHATYGMVVGLLLADMLPERKADFMARIKDFGRSRLLSGVHFRSDVYAGQIAGAIVVATYFKDRNFRCQFYGARDDLREALAFPRMPTHEICPPPQ